MKDKFRSQYEQWLEIVGPEHFAAIWDAVDNVKYMLRGHIEWRLSDLEGAEWDSAALEVTRGLEWYKATMVEVA